MAVPTNYTADELEKQYNVRDGRADYETTVVPDWTARSAEAREKLSCQIGLSYGASDKQKLDFFPTSDSATAPTLIYFHGGYWQRGDKSVYSFIAPSFVKHGINIVVVGYDLCPTVSITTISDQAREALAWIWRNAESLDISKDRLVVTGHSAGGHITGMLMGTDWTMLGSGLPIDLIKAGMPISALNLLEPLRFTTINDAVGMDEGEADSQSPMNNPPVTDAPQLVVCGGAETAEFHRQSDMYVEAFSSAKRTIERYSVPAADHFDELNALVDEASPFFQKTKDLALAT